MGGCPTAVPETGHQKLFGGGHGKKSLEGCWQWLSEIDCHKNGDLRLLATVSGKRLLEVGRW